MAFFLLFLLFAALVVAEDHRFSLPAHPNPSRNRSGPLAYAHAFLKHNRPLPSHLSDYLRNLDLLPGTGSNPAYPARVDTSYLTPITIGTPGQTLNLSLDTGSADLWVFSSSTPDYQVDGQNIYDPSESSTSSKIDGATWSMHYADGTWANGDVWRDVARIGDRVVVEGQGIETATNVSEMFTRNTMMDGILGMAFPRVNSVKPDRVDPLWVGLPDGNKTWTADLKHGEVGTYNFGWIDTSAYTGDIHYLPVQDHADGYWGWTSPGYSIMGTPFVDRPIKGVVDTGTALLLLPRDVVEDYYSRVDSASEDKTAGGYIFDCEAQLPDLTVIILNDTDSHTTPTITVPGRYINFMMVSATIDGTDVKLKCYGGIQPAFDNDLAIFGDVFIKSAFVVFSEYKMLGFAEKNQD